MKSCTPINTKFFCFYILVLWKQLYLFPMFSLCYCLAMFTCILCWPWLLIGCPFSVLCALDIVQFIYFHDLGKIMKYIDHLLQRKLKSTIHSAVIRQQDFTAAGLVINYKSRMHRYSSSQGTKSSPNRQHKIWICLETVFFEKKNRIQEVFHFKSITKLSG